ncbi:RNA polymerase sigma-70 factor, ECF subfamily [Nonlabens sp. Hel1_33_55]|uniref:RNA polymerase sigma factor n=1 Tax=Nonlabens sp. Hel1_33_55 TaxID=1336802 RepID=UPI000875E63C|nr:sigma-70 family RNA polymerase sigma factor [Nonlabens sp. Hel1_33_55]SCY17026.1 RNA polymerase sigma-70 factor, ECF subfamily [Nonlabens sp. Hel1_33_55]
MSQSTDQQILDLVSNPKSLDKGFRLLVKEHQQNLYWQIRKILLNHEDTDDVLQNVFIKIFRGLPKFKGDSKLSTWMFRIAYNESMTFLKRKSKIVQINSAEMQDYLVQQLEADVYFTGDEIQKQLQKALVRLPDRQREIFNMRYYDEIKFKDIAEILELSEGAVKSSYHIAAKKIEAYLKED